MTEEEVTTPREGLIRVRANLTRPRTFFSRTPPLRIFHLEKFLLDPELPWAGLLMGLLATEENFSS